MSPKVKAAVMFEVEQIDQLFDSYKELLEEVRNHEPNIVEITALASIVHSFYNGIEHIFLQIAKKVDGTVPDGERWHSDLLRRMAREQETRQRVISEDLKNKLVDYLGFRHFYRHSYSFFLRWSELEKLVLPLYEIWLEVKNEIVQFLDNQLE